MAPDGSYRAVSAEDRHRFQEGYDKWLPTADAADVAIDEVGLWYEITELGLSAWRELCGSTAEQGNWMLDDHADVGTLEVRAERIEVAEAAIAKWFALHQGVYEIPESRNTATIGAFVLRTGTTVEHGVLVTCRYCSEE